MFYGFLFNLIEMTRTNLDDKTTQIEDKNQNMLINNTNEQKEKKIDKKSKYPRNERVRVS